MHDAMVGPIRTNGGLVDKTKGSKGDLSDAVSQAAQHVHQRRSALEEAAESQKPRPRGPLLAVAGIALLAVLAWDVFVLTKPPAVPPPAVEAEHLRYFVADAVELIEGFRTDQGRLPSRADLGDLLDDEISYQIRGDGYVLGAQGEGASVEYRSGTPLAAWIAGESS